MRFDYYAATIPAQPSHCYNEIIKEFGGAMIDENPIRPYKIGKRHVGHNIRVYSGGCNPLPHIVTSGSESELGSQFLRSVYPKHRVSRADVCADFFEPGGFDRVAAILDSIATEIGMEPDQIGPRLAGSQKGRTIYYGAPSSDVRIRIYEKGLKEIGEGSKTASPDWFRVELQTRPRKQRKASAALLSPSQLWGFSKWTTKAAAQVLDLYPEYLPDASLRQSTAAKAVHHMLKQYHRPMAAYAKEIGHEALLAKIAESLKDE